MPSAPYALLPTRPLSDDATREMDDAFDEEDDDCRNSALISESATFNSRCPTIDSQSTLQRSPPPSAFPIPGSYDFERDYDYTLPPPGSPPGLSASAQPNDYGNSNGLIPNPSSVIGASPRGHGSPSFFRRAVGALLPSHYQRVATEAPSQRFIGGGAENDGVFANVMAKPVRGSRSVRAEDGSVYLAPEETQKEAPPSYVEAQSDAVPSYWETTAVASRELGESGDMIVDSLPTGSVVAFTFNLFTSFFFQFLGFAITCFLSNTHAARYGSRAGLGLTLIQYGAYWRINGGTNGETTDDQGPGTPWQNVTKSNWQSPRSIGDGWSSSPTTPDTFSKNGDLISNSTLYGLSGEFGWNSNDWFALLFMTLGWLLLFSSVIGFWRVKRWELLIRASSQPLQSRTIPDTEQNRLEQRPISLIFDLDQQEVPLMDERDVRLAEDLRAAGLI